MALSRTISGEMKESGFADHPDHKISLEPAGEALTVSVAGRAILTTDKALVLREGDYKPVYYFPREAIDDNLLSKTDKSTWCPFKGAASYYSLAAANGERVENVVWSYEDPFEETAAIKDYLAFYPNKATITPSAL